MSAPPETLRADAAVAAADALLQAARHRLQAARAEIAALEQERRALQDELALMESSTGRRAYLRARAGVLRTARVARHPLWTAGSVARKAASLGPLRTARTAFHYLRRRAFPLRLAAPAAKFTNQPSDVDAIRWIGRVSIRSRLHEALLCHPDSGVEYRVSAAPGGRFVTACAIVPHAWAHGPGPIDFRVEIEIPSLGWQAAAERRVDTTHRYTHRRWHPVSIALPHADASAVDVLVRLSTSLPPGAQGAWAWAIFADPRFEWTRPPHDIRQSIATFAHRLRTEGVVRALASTQRATAAEESAAAYARWVELHSPTAADLERLAAETASLAWQPTISVITPVYNTDPASLRACIESVRRQAYPHWEHCLCDDASSDEETRAVLREYEGDPRIKIARLAENGGISAASNAALALATGDYVALLDHDDEITPDALAEIVRALNAARDTDVLYSDEDKLDLRGRRCDAFFKPDWSPEHFLHCMYTCHVFVARRDLVVAAGGFRKGYEGAQDYDLMLRLMERTSRIGHIPKVLYHWRKLVGSTASAQQAKPWAQDAGRLALEDYVRRNGIAAEVQPGGGMGLFRVRRRIEGTPLVSIVMPTAGQLRDVHGVPTDLLARGIRSLVGRTTWPHYELVIVADPAGLPDTTSRALEGTRHRIIRHHPQGAFNFSRKINEGVAAASGAHVVLFNDDLEVVDGEWLSAMLEYSQQEEIGAVGAKLVYPDGRLQHVGMLLGVNGVAAHAFHQHPGTVAGYFGSVIGPRNFSAVTAACLMTRRAVFDEVGGFDPVFPIDFNDVDYCLRVRRAGYRIVYTPYATLVHHESASFGARQQDPAGIAEMQRRWGAEIACDPYYNPNLTRSYPDYRLQP